MSRPWIGDDSSSVSPVVRLKTVGLSYGKTRALDAITLDIQGGRMVGLI
jgi:ribosome-dependent ATPase